MIAFDKIAKKLTKSLLNLESTSLLYSDYSYIPL